MTSREQLIYLLTEAAELEHGLMCSYLFAGFSLKRESAELTYAEQSAIDRWRTSINAVAMEEMLHLCLVQNLLLAIGAALHVQRPNFPIPPGLYPAGLSIELARFSSETIEHFVFLERPEDAAVSDVAHGGLQYERAPRITGLTPSARDYETVGALYDGIARGFEQFVRRLGRDQLFVGELSAQVDRTLVNLEGLEAVTDLEGVRRAVARLSNKAKADGGRATTPTSFGS